MSASSRPSAAPAPASGGAGGLEALLERPDELARRWAAALVLARPLASLAELGLEELARSGPGLCAQLLRALHSDAELEALARAPAGHAGAALSRRLAVIAGTREPSALVQATETLRGVLWRALLEHAGVGSGLELAELGDRLARACALALAGALDAEPRELAGAGEAARASHTESSAAPEAPEGGLERAGGRSRVVIVDERARAPQITVRDRRRDGPAAWVGAIGAHLDAFATEGEPFVVLLVELAQLERLRGDGERVARAAARLEDALSLSLQPASVALTRERPGRCWVVAAVEDAVAAERLEQRVRAGVAAYARRCGDELPIFVGRALCPDHGTSAAALAAHADVGLYADRASAVARSSAGEGAA